MPKILTELLNTLYELASNAGLPGSRGKRTGTIFAKAKMMHAKRAISASSNWAAITKGATKKNVAQVQMRTMIIGS